MTMPVDYVPKTPVDELRRQKMRRMGWTSTEPIMGSQRRLRALCAVGYSREDLSQLTGIGRRHICRILVGHGGKHSKGVAVRIDRNRADLIRKVYDEYNGKPKFTTSANRTRTWARKQGYAPPGAWTDIDNPRERPKGVQFVTACLICGKEEKQLRRMLCNKHYVQQLRREGRM